MTLQNTTQYMRRFAQFGVTYTVEFSGNWALTVLFVFSVSESKFKDIPSKHQNDHCKWMFRLVLFPQRWCYMFKSMARNCDKTHHVDINASSKDSAPLSFFLLYKNYGPREYDTSNKVLPNPHPKQSNNNIFIEPVSNFVRSSLLIIVHKV